MASQSFYAARASHWVVAALLLCGMSLSNGQEPQNSDEGMSLLQTDMALINGQESPTKSITLQKQYVPHMQNGKLIAYRTAYFGEVKVGTPPQTFTAVFDTGSGHVILPKVSCSSEACLTHRRYDAASSSTSTNIKSDGEALTGMEKERDQVVVSFGTGKVTGEFVDDKICIGESTDCNNMRMVLATEMTEDPFLHFAFDGVVGLALDAIRLNPEFSFFGEMMAHKPQMSPMFSVFLSRHEDGSSTITFGGVDKKRTTSEIAWAPVDMPEHGHWQVSIKQIRIGDTVLQECEDGDCRAAVDTGTSLLGVPRLAVRSMHRLLARAVPADSQDTNNIDCRSVPGHSIDFDLGDNVVVSVPIEDYSRPSPINMTTGLNVTTGLNGSSLICRSLLLPTDMGPPLGPKLFIWGEPVLRRYLTVYDLAKKRIGFSLARQDEFPSGPPVSIGAPPEGSLLIGAPLPPRKRPSSPAAAEIASAKDVVV